MQLQELPSDPPKKRLKNVIHFGAASGTAIRQLS